MTLNMADITKSIVHTAQPEQIILFGSFARGDATPDSDLDLLIIEKEPFLQRSRRAELSKIRKALAPFHVAKDILLFDVDEVKKWKQSPNHVIAQALQEGEVLYARH